MKYVLMGLIKGYQKLISPMLGPVCRFYPSCSHYGYEAIRTHGAVKGTGLTVWRLMRCNPWNSGGVDPVPPRTRPPWRFRSAGTPPERQQTTSTDVTAEGRAEGANTTARGA